ncbi:MAG: HAD family hydrolase [Actinomycetota bacterium]
MIRAVGFDLDNTLFNHTKAAGLGVSSLLAEKNWVLPVGTDVTHQWNVFERQYFDQYLLGNYTLQEHRRARMRSFIGLVGISASESELNDLWDEYLVHYSNSWIAYDDVHSTLKELQGLGIKMGVITNGQQSQQESKLAKLKVSGYFEHVLAIGTMTKPKPHPDPFLQLTSLFDCQPHEILYVGDDLDVDYHASRSAGLQGVWLNRDGFVTQIPIDFQIKSLSSLPSLI